MKIQCNVCEAAEATVLCCADEAALCRACDQKVHAANKLASKHQRVPLSNSASQLPKCDICQEIVGYFFCLQDRALLCRKCDVAIHTANTYVSTHQRFLLTGVKVASEAAEPGASSAGKLDAGEKILETKSQCVFRREREMPITTAQTKVAPLLASGIGDDTANKASFGRRSTTVSIPQWQFDEFLGLEDSVYVDDDAFKVDDSCKIGALNNTPDLGTNEEMNGGDFFLKAAGDSWMVPQIPSPPTASDLYWPDYPSESAASVPDICFPSEPNIRHDQNNAMSKRRRHLHWFDP